MCEHKYTKKVPSGNKTHWKKLVCTKCKKFLKWLPKPEDKKLKKQFVDKITYQGPQENKGGIFGIRHYRN